MTEKVRVLRILEYVGTRDFVEKSLSSRTVKGRYRVTEGHNTGSFIQEAILGDYPEILLSNGPEILPPNGEEEQT